MLIIIYDGHSSLRDCQWALDVNNANDRNLASGQT